MSNTKELEHINKVAAILFYIASLLVVVLCFFFFLSINKTNTSSIKLNVETNNTVYSFIDNCIMGDNYIYVRGWATPIDGIDRHNAKTNVFLMGDKLTLLPKSTITRPDVSSAYKVNGKYNDSGFEASIHHKNIKTLGNKIIILIEKDNKKYVVMHDCKK